MPKQKKTEIHSSTEVVEEEGTRMKKGKKEGEGQNAFGCNYNTGVCVVSVNQMNQ